MRIRPEFDEYYVTNLNEYINTIQTLFAEHKEIYFRGVNEARFNLAPGMARVGTKAPTVAVENDFYLKSRTFINKALSHTEYTGTNTLADMEALAIAQHSGLRTRLLDWSLNPFTSLWFACAGPKGPNADNYCVVWILIAPTNEDVRQTFFNKVKSLTGSLLDLTETLFYAPDNWDSRIKAQSGLFSIHHIDRTRGNFMPLDENELFFPHKFDTNHTFNSETHWNLIKILINRDLYVRDIFETLERFNVHWKTLFPDRDTAAAELNNDFIKHL